MNKFSFSAKHAFDVPTSWTINVGTVAGQTMVTPLIEQEPFLTALFEALFSGRNGEVWLLKVMKAAESAGRNTIYPLQMGRLTVEETESGFVFKDGISSSKPFPLDQLLQIISSIPGMKEVN